MISSPRLRCFISTFYFGRSKAASPSLFFSLSGAILLYRQSVFNCSGPASFVSNEAEVGGAMSDKSNNLIDFSMCPKICHSPHPNMVTYGIWQPSLIDSHTQRYTVAHTKHKKYQQRYIFCLDFTIVPQRPSSRKLYTC